MNMEFVSPFVNATINVLKTMADMDPTPLQPYFKNDSKSFGDVTAIIGLAGKGTKGSFAVSFSETCIVRVVSRMLGEEVAGCSEEIQDAVGEIANMISGGARAKLERKGYSMEMAIPTIVSGKGHSIKHITDLPIIVVPFRTEAGPFFVEACLKEEEPLS